MVTCTFYTYFMPHALSFSWNEQLQLKQSAEVRHHVNVVQFQMNKPAHLPFHLLAWGQQYVRVYNCHAFYMDKTPPNAAGDVSVKPHRLLTAAASDNSTSSVNVTIAKSEINGTKTTVHTRGGATQVQIEYFNPNTVRKIDYNRLPKKDVYEICAPGAIIASVGGPVNVVYLKKFDIGRHKVFRNGGGNSSSGGDSSGHPNPHANPKDTAARNGTERHLHQHHQYPAIKYVYYTESDQVVRYDSFTTLRALTAASNESTFFVGKRREKARDSDPVDYMGSLNIWRECGVPGYSLLWPKDHLVRID